MAYQDLVASFSAARDAALRSPAPAARLTRTEREVIAVAAHDPISSARPVGYLRRAAHWFFAFRQHPPLANPRLEALRRFAVILRIDGSRMDPGEVALLADAGFTPGQIDEATRLVTGAVEVQALPLRPAVTVRELALAA